MTSFDRGRNRGRVIHQSEHPERLLPLRILWVVVTVLSLGLFAVGAYLGQEQFARAIDERALLDLGLTVSSYIAFNIGLNLTVLVIHTLISFIIAWRRPDSSMALFLAIALVANGSLLPLSIVFRPGTVASALMPAANIVIWLGLTSSGALLFIFPTGRFVPRGSQLLLALWAFLAFTTVFLPRSVLSISSWPLPLQILAILIGGATGVFSQIYRYENVSGPVQRQQTKWALIGLAAAVVGPAVWLFVANTSAVGGQVPNILYQRVGASFFTFSLIFQLAGITILRLATNLFPLSFAIAILRYRLWDIDVLINRTLVYGALTGSLALIYGVSVILLQQVFSADTQLATVISTLTSAALFGRLRVSIQHEIDRRFYRQKYDAVQTLAAFNAVARVEVDLDRLSNALLQAVEDSMQPQGIDLWLRGKAEEGGEDLNAPGFSSKRGYVRRDP